MRISDWSSDVCSSDLQKPMEQIDADMSSLDQCGAETNRRADGKRITAEFVSSLQGKIEELAPDCLDRHNDRKRQHHRSEARRVGKECVSTFRSRWSPSP